ncbi:MAG: YjfB family protein [Desulfurella sp.]|jgi:flagellar biosynthesis chaperone FliJ
MQVNTNTQVSVDVLKKAIDTNKNQVNDLLKMQQDAQNKLQTQAQKNDTVPKSNTIGSLFDKKV